MFRILDQIQVLSRSPSTVMIPAEGVGERMDAYPYDVKFLESLNTLKSWNGGQWQELDQLSKFVRCGPFGSNILAENYSIKGVCVIRPFNISDCTVSNDGLVFVPEEECRQNGLRFYETNTLVFARVGNIAVGRIPERSYKFTISPNVIASQLEANLANSSYVCAFLNTMFGLHQLKRAMKVVAQPTISTDTVKKLLIPIPDRRIQDYIGAKVELAERCRAKAMLGFREARERFDELLRTKNLRPRADLSNLITPNLLTQRLSSEFYLPRYFDLDEHLRSLGMKIKTIGDAMRSAIMRTTTPDREESAAIPCILTSDIEPQEIRWREPSLRITPGTYDSHNGRLEKYDVVYTSVGPPVGEAAIVLPEHLPIAVGGDVSVLRTAEDLHPGFLCLYLNSVFGQMQNDRYSRGIRQRRVYPEDIGSFLIPVPKSADQLFIGKRIIMYEHLAEKAVELTNEAKIDVEALIEGTLDTDAILSGKVQPPTWEAITAAIDKEE